MATGQISILPLVRSSTNPPSSTVTNYNGISQGLTTWVTTESNNEGVFGGVSNWFVTRWDMRLATAPGSGKSWTFNIRVNESNTDSAGGSAQIVIIDGNTTGFFDGSTTPLTIRPGDRVSISSVPSGTPTAPGMISECYTFQSTDKNSQSFFTSTASTHTDGGGATNYLCPLYAATGGTVELTGVAPIPTSGTLSALYVDLETDVGLTHTCTVFLRKGSSGGTMSNTALTVAIPGSVGGTSKTGADLTHSVAVTAGDLLCWSINLDAGATTTRARVGCLFSPTIASECVFMQGLNVMAKNVTQYMWGSAGGNVTETLRQALGRACTVKKLYVDSTGGLLAAGQTVTATFRNATIPGSGNTACTITGTATQANSSALSDTVANLDLIDMQFVTNNTGNATLSAAWGIVLDVSQPASPGGGSGNLSLMGVG